jgi:hypothetical protein
MPSWTNNDDTEEEDENAKFGSWFTNYIALHDRKILLCTIDGNAQKLFLDLLCSLSNGHSLYAEVFI